MKKSQIKKALKIIKEQEQKVQEITTILTNLLAPGDTCFGGSRDEVRKARNAAEDAIYELSIDIKQCQDDIVGCFMGNPGCIES